MTGNTIAIVGFGGAMGRWFGRYFAAKGWTVLGYTRDPSNVSRLQASIGVTSLPGSIEVTANLEGCIPRASWIMLSIPVPAHRDVIERVAPVMQSGAVLLDIASVKSEIPGMLRSARERHGIHVLSTHPMFGPGAESMRHKNFIVMDLEGDGKVAGAFKDLISKDDPDIIDTTPEEHDEMVAMTLGLPHFLNILFGTMLSDRGLSLPQMEGFGGTTFHLQHLIAQEVSLQDPSIYAAIQMENKYFINLLDTLRSEMEKLLQLVKDKNENEFVARFTTLKDFFSSTRGFTSVMERFNAAASRSLELLHGRREGAPREP